MHIPPAMPIFFPASGVMVVGYEAVEAIRSEGAQCKGIEEGDHAGCAQYVDARDEVKEEFVQGRVRSKRRRRRRV